MEVDPEWDLLEALLSLGFPLPLPFLLRRRHLMGWGFVFFQFEAQKGSPSLLYTYNILERVATVVIVVVILIVDSCL